MFQSQDRVNGKHFSNGPDDVRHWPSATFLLLLLLFLLMTSIGLVRTNNALVSLVDTQTDFSTHALTRHWRSCAVYTYYCTIELCHGYLHVVQM